MNPFFSIAIPTYEMHGKGKEFLNFSLEKLYRQSFRDFEVIVSDHSVDNEIETLCSSWAERLQIHYHKNTANRGNSSANINNAIENSNGKWIKILFQDDFMFNDDSLTELHKFIISNNYSWIATACEVSNDGYVFYRSFYPKWNHGIQYGNNTISSPSVICINKELKKIKFNEKLIWLMDVEYYKRIYDLNGEPGYLQKSNVVNRTWSHTLTNTIPDEVKHRELQYMIENFYDEKELIFSRLCNLQFDRQLLINRGVVDINEHLNTLREYTSRCVNVTEMGTRFAISTFAFLIGKPNKLTSIDINYHLFKPYEEEVTNFARLCGVKFQFIEADVLKIEIEKTDLLFIDTLHTYNQLLQELRRHHNKVNKWIILHDTVTFGFKDEDFYENAKISESTRNQRIEKQGLYNALTDFLDENNEWKIKEHFTNNNGLTILERTTPI